MFVWLTRLHDASIGFQYWTILKHVQSCACVELNRTIIQKAETVEILTPIVLLSLPRI